MVAQPNRRLVDGENELVTITAIEPRYKGKNHMHPDWWVAKGTLYGQPLHMLVRNTREDRGRFQTAGYVPADLFKNVEVQTRLTVLTAYDGHNLVIAEVVPATETVHSAQERDDAWKLDVSMYGKPAVAGESATFKRMGDSVTWAKDASGRYLRTASGAVTVYEAKKPAYDASAIARILTYNTPSLKRVLVDMKSGACYRFDFQDWRHAAGLVALAQSFGAPEDKRLQSGVKVYKNVA